MGEADRYLTASLRRDAAGRRLAEIMAAVVDDADPRRCVTRCVQATDDALIVDGQSVPLPAAGRILVVGAGKAALGMALGLRDVLGDRIDGGLVVVKHDPPADLDLGPIGIRIGAHPLPDARSVAAGEALLALVAGAGADDLVVCPISGGASALVCAPVPGVDLDALATLTAALLRSGADIGALNAVRQHLDRIKGGGLARAAAPARVVGLVLSDVPGDDLAVVASGPTVPRTASVADARAVLAQLDAVPPAVTAALQRDATPQLPETTRATTHAVGGNARAVQVAMAHARDAGLDTVTLPPLRGEARDVGIALGRRMASLGGDRPTLAVAGGETTVTVRGDGRGGRNQELALAAVPLALGVPGILATLATDGEDGPTDAAGAVVRGDTLARALAAGLDPTAALLDNDAYRFFAALDDLVKPGPTGTNVCDLAFLLVP